RAEVITGIAGRMWIRNPAVPINYKLIHISSSAERNVGGPGVLVDAAERCRRRIPSVEASSDCHLRRTRCNKCEANRAERGMYDLSRMLGRRTIDTAADHDERDHCGECDTRDCGSRNHAMACATARATECTLPLHRSHHSCIECVGVHGDRRTKLSNKLLLHCVQRLCVVHIFSHPLPPAEPRAETPAPCSRASSMPRRQRQ